MLTPCVTSLSKRAYQYSSQKKDGSSPSSLIEKKKKKKELMVLGGQYVVVAVSWLSKEKRCQEECSQKEKMKVIMKKTQHANSKLKMEVTMENYTQDLMKIVFSSKVIGKSIFLKLLFIKIENKKIWISLFTNTFPILIFF